MTIVRLEVPLLIGRTHRLAGAVVIVGDSRASDMIAAGHATPSNARHRVENPEDARPDDPLVPSCDRPGIGAPGVGRGDPGGETAAEADAPAGKPGPPRRRR